MSHDPCVVAAIIRQNGRYFICKRPLHKTHGGTFEFPGGKVNPGESHQEALTRELQEELNITIAVDNLFYTWPEDNSGQSLPIYFYFAHIISGEITLLEHTEGFFAYPFQMNAFLFSKGDQAAVKKLQSLPDSPTPPYLHCIWDFDGTLFNSYPQILKAMDLSLQTLGIYEDKDALLALLKQSVGQAVRTMREKYHIEEDLFTLYQETEKGFPLEDLKPYPGIKELLTSLYQAGVKHYVYTHRGDSTIAYLNQNGMLALFSDIITKKANFPHKPAPDALNWLIEKHQLSKNKTIMIGDRSIDVYAGYHAGIEGCFLDLDHFFTDDEIPADIPLRFHTIDAFCDFLWGISAKSKGK